MGLLRGWPPREPKNDGVAVAEDPSVGGHQPIAEPVQGRRHANHRLVERRGGQRPVGLGRAVGVDGTRGGGDPVGAGWPEPVGQAGQGRHVLIGGEEVAREVVLIAQGARVTPRGHHEGLQGGDGRVPGAGEPRARRRQPQGEEGLDHQARRLRIGLLRQRRGVGVVAPTAVGTLPGGEEGEGIGLDAGRQRALCDEPLNGERGALVVSTLEARGVLGTHPDGLVGEGPAAAGALLARQPTDGRRISRLPCCLQGGQHQALVVRPDEEVVQLCLRPEQACVGPRGLFGGQQPRHKVRPSEVRRVDAHGVRIEDQVGQLAGPVCAVNRDVGIRVGFHVRQGGLRTCAVHVGGGQRQDCVDGGREGAADAAVGSLLAGDPRGSRLRRRELGDLWLRRRSAGGCGERGHAGRRKQHDQADGGGTQQGAADDVHGSRFPDLDPENSAPAGSPRAPVLVSRRWELF